MCHVRSLRKITNHSCSFYLWSSTNYQVPPNCVFTMAVTVNGTTYSGQGKSKKEAKKAAAISAVAELYNVHYDPVA